jgi:hypothetical protein
MKQRATISCPALEVSPPAWLEVPENAEPHEHEALASEPVGQAPGGQDQRGEHQAVGIDDPLELAGRGMQLAHQARQRDVDDRDVEVDRERRQQQRGKYR